MELTRRKDSDHYNKSATVLSQINPQRPIVATTGCWTPTTPRSPSFGRVSRSSAIPPRMSVSIEEDKRKKVNDISHSQLTSYPINILLVSPPVVLCTTFALYLVTQLLHDRSRSYRLPAVPNSVRRASGWLSKNNRIYSMNKNPMF